MIIQFKALQLLFNFTLVEIGHHVSRFLLILSSCCCWCWCCCCCYCCSLLNLFILEDFWKLAERRLTNENRSIIVITYDFFCFSRNKPTNWWINSWNVLLTIFAVSNQMRRKNLMTGRETGMEQIAWIEVLFISFGERSIACSSCKCKKHTQDLANFIYISCTLGQGKFMFQFSLHAWKKNENT